jgi:hypothetical protein
MFAFPTIPESIADGVYIPCNVLGGEESNKLADLGYGGGYPHLKTDPPERNSFVYSRQAGFITRVRTQVRLMNRLSSDS